jgi:hypothetical protein
MDADAALLILRHLLGVVDRFGLGVKKFDRNLARGELHLPLAIAGAFGNMIGLFKAGTTKFLGKDSPSRLEKERGMFLLGLGWRLRRGFFRLRLNENPFFARLVIPNEDDQSADAENREINPEVFIAQETPIAFQ